MYEYMSENLYLILNATSRVIVLAISLYTLFRAFKISWEIRKINKSIAEKKVKGKISGVDYATRDRLYDENKIILLGAIALIVLVTILTKI